MNITEIYKSEKKIMFDKMDKSYPNWRVDKKIVNKVKSAAKQSARNMANAVEIGKMAGVPAKEVMRLAVMLNTGYTKNINISFDVIRHEFNKTKSWVEVLKFVIAKSSNVPESKIGKVIK